jgi:hypothetical protein
MILISEAITITGLIIIYFQPILVVYVRLSGRFVNTNTEAIAIIYGE